MSKRGAVIANASYCALTTGLDAQEGGQARPLDRATATCIVLIALMAEGGTIARLIDSVISTVERHEGPRQFERTDKIRGLPGVLETAFSSMLLFSD